MEGVAHFRRRKCIVLNLKPMHTKDGEDYTIRFNANGRSYEIEHGAEVDLLEPAYNALLQRCDLHDFTTEVDYKTGDVTHKDNVTTVKLYSVTILGDWYWPEGHYPYDQEGNLVRPDLSKEELAKAPLHPNMVKEKPKKKVKEDAA